MKLHSRILKYNVWEENSLDGVNKILDKVKESHCKLEREQKTGKKIEALRSMWKNIKYSHIHVIRVPEGEKKKPEKIY